MAKNPKKNNLEAIKSAIREVLSKEYHSLKIIDIKLTEAFDADDEPILRVDVIFDGWPKDADARRLSGAVRHVRPELNRLGRDAFPMFSFIEKGDLSARRARAA